MPHPSGPPDTLALPGSGNYFISVAPKVGPHEQMSAEDLDRAFEEIADMIPATVPDLPDEALSRESIYTREDEW